MKAENSRLLGPKDLPSNMYFENSDDVFYITYSKGKVWAISIFFWVIAFVPLLPLLLLAKDFSTGEEAFTPENYGLLILTCGPLLLLFAVLGTLFLTKLNKPMATLTNSGFSGLRLFRKRSFEWTPNTVIYFGATTLLANLDPAQSRAILLLRGPKDVVIIQNRLGNQNHQDIMEAINRLSPYFVKQITTRTWPSVKS